MQCVTQDKQSRSQHKLAQFTTNMALRSSMDGGIKTNIGSGACRCYLIKRRCRYQRQAHLPCTRPSKHSVPMTFPVLKPWYSIFTQQQDSQSGIPRSKSSGRQLQIMAGPYLAKRNKIFPNGKGNNKRTYESKTPKLPI